MAVDIGAKVGLEGEAEFKKAITGITQQTKTLKAEMKEATTGFDKNTTAMEKAKAKAEILNKQIEVQKERIEKTKDMLQKATEAYGEADTQTLQFKEQLAKANAELNKLQKDLKDTNPVKAFGEDVQAVGEKLDKIGGKIQSVGDNMTKYVTTPIMAAGGAAVASFKSMDSGYDTIIKKTGATGAELENLKSQANDLYTTMNVSMDDVGAAIGEVNTRFHLTGDEVQALSESFLKFAKVNGTDVTKSVDTVQNALAAFNLDTKSANSVLDTLTRTGQKTGASIDKMASTVVENATAFQQMGLDIYQSIDFMGQFETAGADSASVLSGLKRALKSATESGKPFDQVLAELEDTIKNGNDEMDGLSAAYDLFGKSGAAVYQAVKNGQITFTDFNQTVDILADSMNATSDTYEATLDPIDKFQITLNNVKLTGAEVGTTLLESLTPAIQTVGEAVQKAAEWWNGLDESQQKTILTVAGVVAAIGPVVSIVGKVTSGIGTVIKGVGSVITVLGGLGLSMGATLGILGGVAAAIVIVVAAIKNWDKITAFFSKTWETVTTAVSDAATAVGDLVSEKWNNIKEWTSEAWSNVKETVSNAWNNVKTTVSDAVNKVGSWVSEKWDNIKAKTKETWDNVKAKVAENGGGIKGIIKTAVDGYQNIWQTGFNAINNLTGGKLGEVVTKVTSKLNDIKQKFTDKFNSIKDFVSGVIEKIKGFFNFKWELPKIKLPHFSISGKFSLAPPSIPRISVEWYRKAYNNPVMFTQPTVLATTSGLKGFGDGSGGEIVIGQSMLYAMIRDAAEAGMRSESYTYGDVVVNVYAQPGQDVEELADIVSERIDQQIRRREAAFA